MLSRYRKTVVVFFLIGIFLFILGGKIGPFIIARLKQDHKVIGLVGQFTPSNLPDGVQHLISSGLTDVDASGQAIAAVATSWDISDSGKTYTFKLRNDLFWHDGKPFTAADVNYNLNDVAISAPNTYILQIKLKTPFAPLPSFLSQPLFRKGLVGLGSYKIGAIKLNGEFISYMQLTPRGSDLPNIDIKFYPSETTAKTAFKMGEVNFLDEMTSPEPFSQWSTALVKEIPQYTEYVAVFFNLKVDQLSHKEIRQALAYAFDKPEKNRVSSPIALTSWAYTSQVKQYDKDIETAKKLLKDIPKDTSLTLSTFPQYQSLATRIADAWTAVGIKTTVAVVQQLPSDYQAFLGAQRIISDPDQYPIWHSTQTDANITHYNSAKIDKLLEDGRNTTDIDARKKIYFDFQRYLVEDAPAIFLFHPSTYTISKK
jgi:peptide/nickel transport system substrate-binding protein